MRRLPGGQSRIPILSVVGLTTAFVLSGSACSGSSSDCVTSRTYFEQNVWSAFMEQKCGKCHTPDGVAVSEKGAKFVLQASNYPGFVDANLKMLGEISQIEYQGQSELLLKPIGKMDHGGGKVIEEGGAEYQALQELMTMLKDGDSCEPPPNETLASVTTLTSQQTLRKATLNLVGRLPTKAETDQATNDGGLEKALDAIMTEQAFIDRLREIWNDILLTNKFLAYDGYALNFMNQDQYPGVIPFDDPMTPQDDELRPKVNYSLAREPLDLIGYVVKNDKPFTEILTANYTVVNYYSAMAYGIQGLSFDPNNYYEDLKEAQVVLSNTGVALPHAGVLSTPVFLNRWTTTPTNLNRGRARRLFKFFLATDVLKIAERPVDATTVTAEDNPTRNSTLCNTCHKVIDPVAGAFRGYGDFDYEELDPKAEWHNEMFPPGFGTETLPPSSYETALPWVAAEMANDPRFAINAVRVMYKGLTGHEALSYPADNKSPTFKQELAAWSAQDDFFRALALDFSANKSNLKRIVKKLILSPYFRAESAPKGTDQILLKDIGTGQLLTPEMLNRKIAAITGYRWRKPWDWENQHDWLREDYEILYGGIDSDAVPARLTTPNGLIAAVAARMANETACRLTGYDFTKPKDQRLLFPHTELIEAPESAGHTVEGSVANIKKNIVYLHELFLGEKLTEADPEVERTYQLYLDTWRELETIGDDSVVWDCRGRWDPNTGADLPDAVIIDNDPNFTMRAWMAVITYLLSDWKFLYQ